ncbi:MAG TPA: hypothetical protein DEU95_06315 [Chloroflexi bacterium]|jgi:hypothetical protein|nr:hypothetical protein [Chloroflexota bacterium]HCG29350.1 hypothetical protein [Chloroflexota bacterium]
MMIPRLQAEEMLLWAHVWRVAGGAGSAVAASSHKAAEAAYATYRAFVDQMREQAGIVADEAAAAGRTVLRGADDLRRWFWQEGQVRL